MLAAKCSGNGEGIVPAAWSPYSLISGGMGQANASEITRSNSASSTETCSSAPMHAAQASRTDFFTPGAAPANVSSARSKAASPLSPRGRSVSCVGVALSFSEPIANDRAARASSRVPAHESVESRA